MSAPRCVAVVDGYSSGALFPQYFAKEGSVCVHVQSAPVIPAVFRKSFVPESFAGNVVHSGDLESSIARLRAWNPEQIIAGSETGVELADQLSEAFGFVSNGTALSNARRDKHAMVQALERNCVRSALSFCSSSLETAQAWIDANLDYPVVVKPPKSAATDDVAICKSAVEVKTAFERILGKANCLDLKNESVLIQEFLVGKEYIIDAVSFGAEPVVVAYMESRKTLHEGAMVYDFCTVLPFDSELAEVLYPYVSQVLKALGILWGPSHMEVIITERGPVLVEVAARMDGCRAPENLRPAILVDQCQLTVDCYLNPKTSGEKWARHQFKVHKHHTRVFLISDREGTFCGFGQMENVERLTSFASFVPNLAVGQRLEKTSSLVNIPGYIDLYHEDPAVMWADYFQIRDWEKRANFYLVEL